MIVLNAYEIDDAVAPYWEVYDGEQTTPPDILTEDEFGEWINDPYTRQNYDVRVFTIQSYYEALAGEWEADSVD